MKKILIIACSILLVLCLFWFTFPRFFKPDHISDWFKVSSEEEQKKAIEEIIGTLGDDDAMKYYLRATLAFVDMPKDEQFWEMFWDVQDNGWKEENPAIRELIQQNEPAFALIREGTKKSYCSAIDEEKLHGMHLFASIREIMRFMEVKTMILEADGKHDEVEETLIDMPRFGGHVFNVGTPLYVIIGRALEGMANYCIVGHVKNTQDEGLCEEFLNRLIENEKNRKSLHEVLRASFADAKEWFPKMGTLILYRGTGVLDPGYIANEDRAALGLSVKEPDFFERFIDPFDRAGGYLWFRLVEKRRLRQMNEIHHAILEASKSSCLDIFRTIEQMKIPTDRITRNWYDRGYRDLVGAARCEAVRRATILRVALRLHFLKHGEYPEKLDELAAMVPESFLVDPFSNRPFVYKRTAEGYQFHSFGPDLEDDGGEGWGTEFGAPSDRNYDIVFYQNGKVLFLQPQGR